MMTKWTQILFNMNKRLFFVKNESDIEKVNDLLISSLSPSSYERKKQVVTENIRVSDFLSDGHLMNRLIDLVEDTPKYAELFLLKYGNFSPESFRVFVTVVLYTSIRLGYYYVCIFYKEDIEPFLRISERGMPSNEIPYVVNSFSDKYLCEILAETFKTL